MNKLSLGHKIFGGFVLIAGTSLLLAFVFTYPSAARQRAIFDGTLLVKSADVLSMRLLPRYQQHEFNLVHAPLLIKDRDQINRICQALNGAKQFSANHPSGGWNVVLEIESTSGTFAADIVNTPQAENGTFVSLKSDGHEGWALGDYRCDELRDVLREVAGVKSK